MDHDELAARIAAALRAEGLIAYAHAVPGDARGMHVEVVTGHSDRWHLALERAPL